MTSTTQFLLVKSQAAAKTGLHAKGAITYAVLKDAEEVYLLLLGNDGGGYFSREAVSFSALERCLEGLAADKPLPAKTFKPAFRSRSANNAGFMAAVLRQEGLLVAAPDAAHQHRLGQEWAEWRRAMLAAPGERFVPPGAAPVEPPQAAASITNAEEAVEPGAGKGRKSRKIPKAERQPPSGEEADHASNP